MTEFEGIVTSAFSNYGIIDEEIYFDYDAVQGELPAIGNEVVGVKEVSSSGGYRALSLYIKEELALIKTSVIGPMLRTQDGYGYVEDVPFKLSVLNPVPAKGDVLNVNLQEINGVIIGSSVSYIRQRRFTSYVMKAHPRESILEESCYFTQDACPRGYCPQFRDIVDVVAVECQHKEFSWRAIEITPTSGTSYKKPLSLYKLPRFCLNPSFRECSLGQEEGSPVLITPHSLRLGHLNPGETTLLHFNIVNYSGVELQLTDYVLSGEGMIRCAAPLPLTVTDTTSVPFSFTNADLGQNSVLLQFLLLIKGKKLGQISRRIFINIVTPTSAKSLKINPDVKFLEGSEIVAGPRPQRDSPKFYPNHFPMYEIPAEIKDDTDDESLAEELNERNYKYIFHKLLYMEEHYIAGQMEQYSLYEVSLMNRGAYLSLNVPGLTQSKMVPLIGDRVILEFKEGRAVKYEGYVHKVVEDTEDLLLKFEEGFQRRYESEHVNIHFTHNRTSLRRCHLAVDFVTKNGKEIIFPRNVVVKPPHYNVSKLKFFNELLNREQRSAVKHIIEAKARPIPYLLFGPPGTGKTVTLVETILQIYRLQADSRLLVCAPSNSACDLLAQRLHDAPLDVDMVRLNSISRNTEKLTPELQAISMNCDNVKEASLKRVIIATCISAGNLYKLGLRTSHFTHVFVDEAGQAIEPECVLPVALSTGPGTQAVLAGDPFQLGPVIQSTAVEMLGLSISLLERLMDSTIYDKSSLYPDNNYYDPILLTKLVKNYRSHESLLTVPSALFYCNDLQPHAPPQLVNMFIGSTLLPNPSVPLIFHGVRGEQIRENNNPSWYNPTEIMQVANYIKALSKEGIECKDVGVITPYRKQAEKTRMMLKSCEIEGVKVASVEDFQGQERPVIIISTVRSNDTGLADNRALLGFLQNPKRFNVAITRAQALLIIIGNPNVLQHDPHWNTVLEYAQDNGCYKGVNIDDSIM